MAVIPFVMILTYRSLQLLAGVIHIDRFTANSTLSQQLLTMLRDKTAAQLEYDGRPALATMGVSEGTIDAFYATPNLTPTDKAVILKALKSLGTTSGREIFVAGTAHAPSRWASSIDAKPN
jgi:hypothetical protein